MKALELTKWLDDFHGADAQFPSKASQDAASELRRLAEVNAELLEALEAARNNPGDCCPWLDIASNAIAKAKEQQ